ncbi:hypothetical protein CHUAL_002525 [Chamberlinius hualienensis]
MDFEIRDLMDDEERQNDEDGKMKNKKDSKDDKPAIKRTPRVTLNAERLTGERGIAQLPKIFSQVNFKGKGYEKRDLDVLLKTMEHWSHRLFPRLQFNDIIEKMEVLGTKRPVQNCLRKLRLDMPILSSDFVDDDDDEPEEQVPERENVTVVDDDIFEQIFGDARGNETSTVYAETQTSQPPPPSDKLTFEERQKIAMNRLKALEKLKQKTQQQDTTVNKETQQNDESLVNENLQVEDPPENETNDYLTENEMLELMEQDGGLS